jgi:hypothetical protein
MSYREENNQVILTMDWKDYEYLIFLIAKAHGEMLKAGESRPNEIAFMNRLNSGNPHYTPYHLPREAAANTNANNNLTTGAQEGQVDSRNGLKQIPDVD